MYRTDFTQEYLKECIRYEPDTGLIYWLNRPRTHFKSDRAFSSWNKKYSGKLAGNNRGKYIGITLTHRHFPAHRIVWCYIYGEWPKGEVGHIKRNKKDNRQENLRDVARRDNSKNLKPDHRNKSGILGVSYRTGNNKWYVQIGGHPSIGLGFYDHLFEAACARRSAENRLGYHPNHGRPLPTIAENNL